MKTLRESLRDAEAGGYALGHFNISDLAALMAIANVAIEMEVPVLIGTSEGEAGFLGYREVAAVVKALREEHQHPIFLNADHTRSIEKIKEAAEAGYDMVIFDGAQHPFEENVRLTKEAVTLAKSINPNIVVEGELGYIGTSSEVLKEVPPGAALTPGQMTSPEEAEAFVEETGVDMFAPAVGNVHGIVIAKGFIEKLHIPRIEEIRNMVHVPLVLHGASGLADGDIRAAVAAGIRVVHINTELRIAWRKGMEEGLKEKPDEVAPYKIYPKAMEAMKKVVREKLELLSGN